MSTGLRAHGLSSTSKSSMTGITSLLDTQVSAQLPPLDIWPDFTPTHLTHNGFTAQSKSKTLDTLFITESSTDLTESLTKVSSELLTEFKIHIPSFHGTNANS